MKAYATLVVLVAVAVCVSAAGLSECQRKRENSLRNQANPKKNQTNIENVGLVVECNEDGTYKPLQCFPPSTNGKRFCLCYDSEGQVLKQPSRNTVTCDCVLEKHKNQSRGKPVRPCNPDGSFQ